MKGELIIMGNFFISRHTLLLMIKMLKASIYTMLAIFLYTNIIGAEGIADLLKIENPNTDGLNKINIEIPRYVLNFTFIAVILEILSNILEVPDTLRNNVEQRMKNNRLPY